MLYDKRYGKISEMNSGKYQLYKVLKLIQENLSRLLTEDLVIMMYVSTQKALFLDYF